MPNIHFMNKKKIKAIDKRKKGIKKNSNTLIHTKSYLLTVKLYIVYSIPVCVCKEIN